MKAKEVRGKEDAELRFDTDQLEKQLFELRFRSLVEANSDPSQIRRNRRDIARMKTILQERQLGIRGQESR